MRRRAATLVALATLSAVWGTQYLVIRLAQADVPPWRAVALRFAVVAVVGQVAVLAARAQAPPGALRLRLAMGATQALSMGLLYAGQQRLPSALASVLMATTPMFVVALAHRFLRERAAWRTLLAGGLGLCGIVLISGANLDDRLAAIGVVLLLGAALASAVSKTIGKAIAELPIAILLRDLGAVVALVGLGASVALEPDAAWMLSASELAAAAYLGAVASAGANAVYFGLLRRIDVSRLSYLQLVSASIGLVAGVVVGGEELEPGAFSGAALVLAGAGLLASSGRPTRTSCPSPLSARATSPCTNAWRDPARWRPSELRTREIAPSRRDVL